MKIKMGEVFSNMEFKLQAKSLFTGVVIGYAITCLVFISYALLLTYTAITEENISLVVTLTTIVSVLVAGFDAARGASSKGWLWGIVAGFSYAVILVGIMSWIQQSLILDSRAITLLILSLAGGGLGGVIGINLKK